MKLPQKFTDEVRELIGEEGLRAYLEAMDRPYEQGLRVNPLKTDPETLGSLLEKELGRPAFSEEVAWCSLGRYLVKDLPALSHSPYYYAGAYYLQEPSAMAPAAILPVGKGDRVLDLCAAPGGKTTALGAKLGDSGILVANDISPSRAQALLKNVEMFGLGRCIVSCEAPHKLAERFPHFFTRILIDAPCSGEGMFRKEPVIVKNWAQYGSEYYAGLQKEILKSVPKLLAPGGMLLYSTCTYSPAENERQLDDFLNNNPDFHLQCFDHVGGMMDGVPDWSDSGRSELAYTAHFWPHLVRGEGHFAALLVRDGTAEVKDLQRPSSTDDEKSLRQWAAENLTKELSEVLPEGSRIVRSGENLYAMLLSPDELKNLRILRPGLLIGSTAYERFEPSQALAMYLKAADAKNVLELSEEAALRYLKGETLSEELTGCPIPDGWILLCRDGFPLGWGKASGGISKNKYLKGWRMRR